MKKLLSFVFIFSYFQIHSMNFLRPWDVIMRPELHWQKSWMVAAWAEKGVRSGIGFNDDDVRVNDLQIWQPKQDALAMLAGFAPESPQSILLTQVNAIDDGIRGNFIFSGNLNLNFSTILGIYYKFCNYFWFTTYFPFVGMQLNNVGFTDLTHNVTPADIRVKTYLTNDFAQNVASLGGPALRGWKRSGLQDIVSMVEWYKEYPQRRPLLRSVGLGWNAGISIPTGKPESANVLFGLPLDDDVAWAIIWGGNLRVLLAEYFRAGIDVRLIHHFGNTRCRRIKTAESQTDLLLLATAPAYKDYGLMQRFTLYGQAYQVCNSGFSLLLGYQFIKKGSDSLELQTCDFSTSIANTAQSLKSWTIHQAVIIVSYEFFKDFRNEKIWPELRIFTRLPFNGRRSINFPTIGATLSIEF